MIHIKKNLIIFYLLFLVLNYTKAQTFTKDTIFNSSNIIWRIESKKDSSRFGYSNTYLTYTKDLKLDYSQFYLNDRLFGLDIQYDWNGKIWRLTNYRNGEPIFEKRFSSNGEKTERYFNLLNVNIQYSKDGIIEFIEYLDLGEEVEFYPNYYVKSITLTDSSHSSLSRKYYEFAINGTLTIDGVFADSFISVLDTIITYDPETYEEIYQVIEVFVPLKNGYWLYYNNEGILVERKLFKYFSDRKGKTIRK